MSRQHHKRKCETEFYQDIEQGKKKFELRINDRDYRRGDMITLVEVVDGKRTGHSLEPVEIKYILYGGIFGLPKKMCIFNW